MLHANSKASTSPHQKTIKGHIELQAFKLREPTNVSSFIDYDFSNPVTTNPIFNLLKNDFFTDQVKARTGGCFMPLPFPTGVGKTYNTLCLILEAMLDDIYNQLHQTDYKPRLCFYITNSVDNVFEAYSDLQNIIETHKELTRAQKDILEDSVLYAPSNDSSLLNVITEKPDDLKKIIELFNIERNSNLISDLRSIERLISLKERLQKDPELLKDFEIQLRAKASECYTQLVRHIQRVQLGDNSVSLNEANVRLLSTLIPGVLLEFGFTRVIFMTTKKFLFGLQQSQGKYHPIHDLTDNILVIDELDRQNQEILTHLVRTNDTDLLGTIRTLHANLRSQQLCKKPQYAGISELFTAYLDEVKSFYEFWQLQFSFDIDPTLFEDKKEILLFSDKMTTHNTSINKQLCVGLNPSLQQHIIATYGSLDIPSIHNFPQFLGKLEKLVNRRFHSLIRSAEEKYRSNLNTLQSFSNAPRVTSTQAIASILDQLNLHSLRQQLAHQLNYLVGHQHNDRKSAANYHTRGLRLIEIDRLPEAQDSVMFKHHGFNVTPTGMLATWIESGCYVLGVSATAECKSVIHNFHIKYLKSSLPTRYVELSPSQKKSIHDYYATERNYDASGVNIIAKSVEPNPAYLKDLLRKWKPTASNIDLLLNTLLELEYRNDEATLAFSYGWLSRLCIAIEEFIEQKNNRYMMIMLNRSVRSNLAGFLTWFVQLLEKSHEMSVKLVSKINAEFLRNGQFDSEVIKFLEESPGKLVAITTYQTMSSGKNPDYTFNPELESESLHHVGHRYSCRTDIDSLYLELPTNVISVSEAPETKTTDRLLLLSYGLALQEAGHITPSQAWSWCKDVVEQASPFNTCNQLKGKFYSRSEDYIHAVLRMTEQAVGRTARTAMKRSNILLLADDDLIGLLTQDNREDTLFSHEYKKLVSLAKFTTQSSYIAKNKSAQAQHNLAVLNTGRSLRAINNLLQGIDQRTDKESIASWKQLRQLALANPTSTMPPMNAEYYVHSPTLGSYSYSRPEYENQTNNYLFFDSIGAPENRVSERECRLHMLRSNKVVSDHFERKRYPLTWCSDAPYILTPPMFTNIYKGALGEEAGEAILNHYGFVLTELPMEHFERFDGLIELHGEKALIDFKHWDLGRWRSKPDELKKEVMTKLTVKARAIGLSRLVVCNLLGELDDPIFYFDENFKVCIHPSQASIIALPSLLCESTGITNTEAMLALANWLTPNKES